MIDMCLKGEFGKKKNTSYSSHNQLSQKLNSLFIFSLTDLPYMNTILYCYLA